LDTNNKIAKVPRRIDTLCVCPECVTMLSMEDSTDSIDEMMVRWMDAMDGWMDRIEALAL
jgi:hypothetical protein